VGGLSRGSLRACRRAPAAAGAGLWLTRALEPRPDVLGLLDVVVGRTPEQQTAGDAPDGDGHLELRGHTEDGVSADLLYGFGHIILQNSGIGGLTLI
jgi:hypothetical protein